jgi:hypothetical protein
MIRTVAVLSFALSLLCPVFCLTKTAEACHAQDQPNNENCEAMSSGALVERFDNHTLTNPSPSCLDGVLPFDLSRIHPHVRAPLAPRHRDPVLRPPSAARRLALLQSFLF